MLCWRSPFSFSSARWVSNFQANIITLFMLTFLSITCSSTRFSADKFRLIVISKCLRAIGHLLNKIPRENNNYCSLKWDICINVIRILEPVDFLKVWRSVSIQLHAFCNHVFSCFHKSIKIFASLHHKTE